MTSCINARWIVSTTPTSRAIFAPAQSTRMRSFVSREPFAIIGRMPSIICSSVISTPVGAPGQQAVRGGLADRVDQPARLGRVLKLVDGAVQIDLTVMPELRPRVAARAEDLDRVGTDLLLGHERM
jgi:hypothetical protein